MIVETYYPEQQACPVCNTDRAVTLKEAPEFVYRCKICGEALKLDGEGGMVPWLDIYRAGRGRKKGTPGGRGEPCGVRRGNFVHNTMKR